MIVVGGLSGFSADGGLVRYRDDGVLVVWQRADDEMDAEGSQTIGGKAERVKGERGMEGALTPSSAGAGASSPSPRLPVGELSPLPVGEGRNRLLPSTAVVRLRTQGKGSRAAALQG